MKVKDATPGNLPFKIGDYWAEPELTVVGYKFSERHSPSLETVSTPLVYEDGHWLMPHPTEPEWVEAPPLVEIEPEVCCAI